MTAELNQAEENLAKIQEGRLLIASKHDELELETNSQISRMSQSQTLA